ncbi:hypothetical protein [Rhodococcus sp. IEGM 1408]|uniref:PH-like domain-containing protein n=1 Tax=Rhodococcus sp. IEGM 1408 TaxID=3082220 RepID=UPI002953E70D|nr:hypothetical protein [Rhodococcus sp. IEGM 1408]MDV8000309.1 hypothetical protein [Rhodococcus sp. IEGM 1408]
MNQDVFTVALVILVFAGILGLMALGWRKRSRSQAGLYDELPTAPGDPGEVVLGPLSGVYIGSTLAGDWNARIARAPLGFRSAGTLTAHTGGLRLDLADATVWIPRADLVHVRRASALANKTVPGGGILVARWQVDGRDGHTVIDSGFRADDKDSYPRWEALRGDAAPSDQPDTTAPDSTSEEKQ